MPIKGVINKKGIRKSRKEAGKTKRKAPKKPFWLQLFVCLFILAFITCMITYLNFMEYFAKSADDSVVEIDMENAIPVRIPTGASTADIARILAEEKLIKSEFMFKVISKFEGFDGRYKSGTHLLNKGMDLIDIMKILCNKPESIRITFPEGFNVKKIAARLERYGLVDADEFIKTVNTVDFSDEYSFLKGIKDSGRDMKLEGYLFPDTYEFDMMADSKTIIRTMLNRFQQLYTSEFHEQAKKLGLTMDQVIILASIIEKEAAVASERKTISGVFHNRLKKPKDASLKKLQSCATIQYIIERDTGKVKEVITAEDEKIDDPYNTYIHEGLPPGPICSPGLASIKAALYPESHDYYYFSAKNDGSGEHYFAKTYSEHLQNQKR